ncbi:hypothetical protein ITP53_09750 [Nonomuraea sp. K274]|uniref:Uncharacterized protein n=1 Tax=Nonomuraea cypriaca TaxID=1187855 RepID=A0A931A7D2_9ACTN|nr:hypothetical protein [Nonomuraea cypriaca]MBF8186024.1 hypothetical protein [Nonomuraea cypriaca]
MTNVLHRLRIIAACCLTALGVGFVLASAWSPEPIDAAGHDHHQAGPGPRPTATMERIIAAARCPRPQEQGHSAEFRQVVCQSPQGRYTIMTFAAPAGKDAWLDEAEPYGGTYLGGDRWAVVSAPALLRELRDQLGGEIRGHRRGGQEPS